MQHTGPSIIIDALQQLFLRDLDRLRDEIEAHEDGPALWSTSGTVTNSAGNLCLHLCGNLQHFIGAVLGGSGYVRDREHEFSARNIPRKILLDEIDRTKDSIAATLGSMDADALVRTYPVKVFAEAMSTGQFLIHLHGHLNYHLGQINYLRRCSPAWEG